MKIRCSCFHFFFFFDSNSLATTVGQARNVYFPFDIHSDTATDVATEMVKELEITDWEPWEIAEMIDEEISALVPSWKEGECDLPLYQNQHSFNYNEEGDDDDNRTQHPFYDLSSHSSSHSSLPGLCNSRKTQFHRSKNMMTCSHDWVQGTFHYLVITNSGKIAITKMKKQTHTHMKDLQRQVLRVKDFLQF